MKTLQWINQVRCCKASMLLQLENEFFFLSLNIEPFQRLGGRLNALPEVAVIDIVTKTIHTLQSGVPIQLENFGGENTPQYIQVIFVGGLHNQ